MMWKIMYDLDDVATIIAEKSLLVLVSSSEVGVMGVMDMLYNSFFE
jgi:hypothetical protein